MLQQLYMSRLALSSYAFCGAFGKDPASSLLDWRFDKLCAWRYNAYCFLLFLSAFFGATERLVLVLIPYDDELSIRKVTDNFELTTICTVQ